MPLLRLTTAAEEVARQGDTFSTWTGLLSVLAILLLVSLWNGGNSGGTT
mgnify:FL=1